MVRKVYKEGYQIIVEPPISEELEFTNATWCSFGFDKDPNDNDVVWVRSDVSGRYIYNGLVSDMTDVNGKPIGDKESVENYLLGVIGDGSSSVVDENYQISFLAANSESLVLPSRLSLGDFYIESDLTSDLNSNSQAFCEGDTNNDTNIFQANGTVKLDTGTTSIISGNDVLPRTGTFKYKIQRIGSDVFVYVNDELTYNYSHGTEVFDIDRFFATLSLYFTGSCRWLNINGEVFRFTEGSGSSTTGSKGTVLALSSSGTIDDMWESI